MRRYLAAATMVFAFAACGEDDEKKPSTEKDTSTENDAGGDTVTPGDDASPEDTAVPDDTATEDSSMPDDTSEPEDTSTPDDTGTPDAGPQTERERCLAAETRTCSRVGQRSVCGRCIDEANRLCYSDNDCRAGETCVDDEDGQKGLCTYVPAPLRTCPGSAGCESTDGPLKAGFGKAFFTPRFELPRPRYIDGQKFTGDALKPETFCDCGRDMICPPGEDFADCPSLGTWVGPDADGTEGDGIMQGAWIAGFSVSRSARLCDEQWLTENGCEGPACCVSRWAHDHQWARGAVFQKGDLRIAIVTVDTVGYFYSDLQRAQARLPAELGIDHLIVTATHTHGAADTMGQWGPGSGGSDLPATTGATPEMMSDIYDAIVDAVTQGVENLADADIYAAYVDVAQTDAGPGGFAMGDGRDPFIWDDRVTVLHFVKDGGDRKDNTDTLGVMLNWHSHPEVAWSEQPFLTSDYAHFFREYIEKGLPAYEPEGSGETALPGYEGLCAEGNEDCVAVFTSGAVGGLLGPGTARLTKRGTNEPIPRECTGFDWEACDADLMSCLTRCWDRVDALGERLAEAVFETLAEDEPLTSPVPVNGPIRGWMKVPDETLSFATRELLININNKIFQLAALTLKLFDRPVVNWRQSFGLNNADLQPKVVSRVSAVRLGNVTFQSFPGELFPEILVGGFDKDNVAGNPMVGDPNDRRCGADGMPVVGGTGDQPCIINPNNPNPPNLANAPQGPYMRESLPGDFHYILGLGDDALGYLIPAYDFQLDSGSPYLAQPPGDHYEETNSTGPNLPHILDTIQELWPGIDVIP